MTTAGLTSGLLGELRLRVDEYFRWVRDRTVLAQVEGNRDYVEVTTPHLDRHSDCIQFYVRRDGSGYLLTDDGSTINDLEMSGCKLDSRKRRELLRLTLSGFGVEREGQALIVRTSADAFPRKKHDLIQAMLAVNDLFALSAPTIASLFIEDVGDWLVENNIRSVPRVKLAGRSGYDHTFDFIIPGFASAPERIVQTINRPNKETAEQMDFKWFDTRDTRVKNSVAFALLNDQEQTIPAGVTEALRSYDITPVLWSERASVVERLAA